MEVRSTKSAAKACSRKRVLNVAVLFVDIQGCTRLCEDLRPDAMARIIERYFSRFLQLVENHHGYVAEVHGDGLLALFEGPSLARRRTRLFGGLRNLACHESAQRGARSPA